MSKLVLRISAVVGLLVSVPLHAQVAKPDIKKELAEAKKLMTSMKADTYEFYVKTLADDKLEGRLAGSKGAEQAANEIANAFKKFGIKPAGDKDVKGKPTYFQKFTLPKKGGETMNVVGIYEGSDKDLKSQYVVLGAHYDHIGQVGDLPQQQLGKAVGEDKIFNGADDNASGTSAIITIAEALYRAKPKTKRSILLLAFSGEEWGLLGSEHYSKNPITDIKTHYAMLNIDMIGRNPDKPCGVYGGGTETGTVFEDLVKSAAELTGLKYDMIQASSIQGGDSDHTPFKKQGVPVIFFYTGDHGDYHKVTDHTKKIAFQHAFQITATYAIVGYRLAMCQDELKFADPDKK